MPRTAPRVAVALLLLSAAEPARAIRQAPAAYDVRTFGARGDGKDVRSMMPDRVETPRAGVTTFAVLREVAESHRAERRRRS